MSRFNDIHNYFDKEKISVYILFSLIMIPLIILSVIVSVHRKFSIKYLIFAILAIHFISICLFIIALYFKQNVSEIYSFILISVISIYFITLTLYLHIYKQYRENNNLRNTTNQRFLQLMILLTIIMIVLNILLRNTNIIYIINIIFAVSTFSFVLFIYNQQTSLIK